MDVHCNVFCYSRDESVACNNGEYACQSVPGIPHEVSLQPDDVHNQRI